MRHEDAWLEGVGGARIYWQAWLPEGDSRASVVLAHGVSEHSSRYVHVGAALAASGYGLHALDHRGHGRSDGSGANIERLDHVVADLLTLVELITGRDGGRRPFLLGHSMGGGISIAYAIEHQETLAGLLLSGPVAVNEAASPATRAMARLTSAIAPKLGVYTVDAETVSRDPEVVRAYVEDPMVHHGKLPARTVSEMVERVNRFPAELPTLRLPLLVMHGGDDTLVPVAGSRLVDELAGSEDKTLKIYQGLHHEILNEPERDQVISDIVAWLNKRS